MIGGIEMEISTSEYDGNEIRFLRLPENGLLLNTKDVCGLLGVKVRPPGTALSQPCLDLASAIGIAGQNNADFAMWLNEAFAGYDLETLIHPRCNDEWSFD